MSDALQTMIDNLPEKTGKSLGEWKTHLGTTDLAKHGQIMKHLKGEHGVTHGFANLIASQFLTDQAPPPTDLVAAQYAKKPGLKPIYDAIVAAIADLDHELIPKKTAVAAKRNKQFLYICPATKTRVDLGIQLKGEDGTERLQKKKGGMTSHIVRLTAPEQVDEEVIGWMKTAWERC